MSIFDSIYLYPHRDFMTDRVGFTLVDQSGETVLIGQPVEMAPYDPAGYPPPKTFLLSENAVQRLMDELWNIGYRPSEGSGSAGALAATQRHLDDMRKLAFDLMENMVLGK
jgi:hypothetical protein